MAKKNKPDSRSNYFSKPALNYYYGFLKEDRTVLIATSLGFVAVSYLILPTLWLVKYIFDVAIPQKQIDNFIWIGLAILALRVINSVINLYLRNLNIKMISASIYRIRENLTGKIFNLSRSFYTREDLGILHTRIVQDTERITRMANAFIASTIPSLLNGLGMIVVLIYLNWFLFLTVLVFFPLLYFSNKYMGKITKRKVREYQRAFEGFSKGTLFLVKFMELIKLQSVEDEEGEKHSDTLHNLKEKTNKRTFFDVLNAQLQNIIVGLIGIIILVVGGISVSKGLMSLGALMAFYLAANQLQSKLNILSNSFTSLLTGNESLVTLYNISIQEDTEPYKGHEKITFKGNIHFSSVNFKYTDVPVLKSVSFKIEPGDQIAIVGANGAGKSTIISLILGFYKPQSGNIAAEGVDYEQIDFKYFRKQIGVVTQHPPLIPGTIRENILYGTNDAPIEQIHEVSHLSKADLFIRNLPSGYDTQIGENGVLLSGGERQKLAIARALLRRPGLLILDEPTNHLDSAAVKEIMNNIKLLDYHPAILIISHDSGVVNHAEKIYLIEGGELLLQNLKQDLQTDA